METILVTGGAGYIGSHICKALKTAGFLPVVFDNFSHGHEWAAAFGPTVRGDLQNRDDIDKAFTEYSPRAVIHLAASIHLRESIEKPLLHYQNNVMGTLSLLSAMADHGISELVFSSSAAVYAPPEYLPIDEKHPKGPMNPYGKTKWMCEQIIQDFSVAHGLKAVCLRYFNAAGADPEGQIGEAHDPETHVIPRLLFTAQGKQPHFTIYSSKLPTPDGTAVRDYIHVTDLASGHLCALKLLPSLKGAEAFNLGTGHGYSVLEMHEEAQKVTGFSIPLKHEERNIAESPSLVADPKKAKEQLGWTPEYSDLSTIIETAWNWHNIPVLV